MGYPRLMAALAMAVSSTALTAAPAAPLKFEKGDHVVLIGNSLADNMQHDGWLEAQIYTRFPTEELVFRNMGFHGDEVAFRDRSQDFGTPDHWLANQKADVILAFFGYNESSGGPDGLDKFKKDYDAFVKSTLKQKYNGEAPPGSSCLAPPQSKTFTTPTILTAKSTTRA